MTGSEVTKLIKREEEEEILDEEKKNILNLAEISLALDTYNDLFSSFDPRPYSERALSDDFLQEIKRASKDKPDGKIKLRFLIPEFKRNVYQEKLIKKRLREHFKRHSLLLEKEKRNVIKTGLAFTISGIIVMLVASFILFKQEGTFLVSFLVVLFEPAGWFLFWEGLNQAIFESKEINPNLNFYRKMSTSEIEFLEI